MASFQAKIGWKRPRNRKIINYRNRNYPTQHVIEISKKIAKKIEKTKQYHYGFISSKNKLEKAEKEKNVNYRSVPFLHDT